MLLQVMLLQVCRQCCCRSANNAAAGLKIMLLQVRKYSVLGALLQVRE